MSRNYLFDMNDKPMEDLSQNGHLMLPSSKNTSLSHLGEQGT